MNFADLERFVVLAEELNYHRAAERLGISQQRLSRCIMDLEGHTRLHLFRRTTRSVNLTAAGVTLLAGARETLDSMRRSIDSARLAAQGHTGRISVAVSGFALEGTLPFLLRRFGEMAPRAELDLRETESAAQEDALVRGAIDVGFAVLDPKRRDVLRYEVVATNGFVVVATDQEKRMSVRPEDLRDRPLVLTSADVEPAIRATIMQVFRDADVTPRITHEIRQKTVLFGFVVAGLGSPSCRRRRRTSGEWAFGTRAWRRSAPPRSRWCRARTTRTRCSRRCAKSC